MRPLVTIIALSYNHGPYIPEALASVYHQSYPFIELIIVDDASIDDSVEKINQNIQSVFPTTVITNKTNIGNCQSFNRALIKANGDYIIDFALDDVLYFNRVEYQVNQMEQWGASVGLTFCNVDLISSDGEKIGDHATTVSIQKYLPTSDWLSLITYRYIINPVGTMMRKELLKELNGYDINLRYEDFDLWVRAALVTKIEYIPTILSAKRIVPESLSLHPALELDRAYTTLTVCKKLVWLHLQGQYNAKLVWRLRYEWRNAFKFKTIRKEYEVLLEQTDKWYIVYKYIIRWL
ncbi:MAG: glycosyltransferase [Cytophagaceae bacterium]|jgi:hypothetical protein|nr:glycosyltransferase [Cytophagaceae bacterium]